jgi:hypothetical protein
VNRAINRRVEITLFTTRQGGQASAASAAPPAPAASR